MPRRSPYSGIRFFLILPMVQRSINRAKAVPSIEYGVVQSSPSTTGADTSKKVRHTSRHDHQGSVPFDEVKNGTVFLEMP
jgi:hypothetical protein